VRTGATWSKKVVPEMKRWMKGEDAPTVDLVGRARRAAQG
jgi:hypothetical protein